MWKYNLSMTHKLKSDLNRFIYSTSGLANDSLQAFEKKSLIFLLKAQGTCDGYQVFITLIQLFICNECSQQWWNATSRYTYKMKQHPPQM